MLATTLLLHMRNVIQRRNHTRKQIIKVGKEKAPPCNCVTKVDTVKVPQLQSRHTANYRRTENNHNTIT